MKLQQIIYPSKDICTKNDLYFRGLNYIVSNNSIIINKGGYINTSTYFNGFCLTKWYKYTKINNLKLNLFIKGNGIIEVYNYFNGVEFKIYCKKFASNIFKNYSFKILNNEGYLYYSIKSSSKVEIKEMFYESKCRLNNIKLAIGTCTYKREEYIIKTLDLLEKELNNNNSILFKKVDVYVSDNYGSLNPSKYKNISIFKNKNYGGAGGFTRCLIEAKQRKKYHRFLFLDDDILLDINSIYKTYLFASLLKKEFENLVIGGSMLDIKNMHVQYESSARWDKKGFTFYNRNLDLRDFNNVIKNEYENNSNYNAWCFCCIPFYIVNDINLPLPFFFHMDDVEYCLRNKFQIITLNGICVWHLFDRKIIRSRNDYYDIRNRLIMMSNIDENQVLKWGYIYSSSFTSEILKFHYYRAINAFKAILDYSKGPFWFEKQDTIKLHNKINNKPAWTNASDEDISKCVFSKNNDNSKKKWRILYFLNQLLPAFKTKYIFNNNSISDSIHARKIIVVDKDKKKKIIYKKNLCLLMYCLILRSISRFVLKHKINKATVCYKTNICNLKSLEYWENKLDINRRKIQKKCLFVASDASMTSGAFRSMSLLANLLKTNYNLNVHVLLPFYGDGVLLLEKYGIEYKIIKSEDWIINLDASFNEKIKKIKRMLIINTKSYKKTLKYLKKEDFDIVHINTSYTYVAAKAAKKLKIPVYWHLREFLEEDQEKKFIFKNYALNLLNASKKVITISNSLYNKYKSLILKNKLIKIYNGIDQKDFICNHHEILNKKLNLLCVGHLVNHKGQLDLIKAACLLSKKGIDFDLYLVGKSNNLYLSKLQELIYKNNISNKVHFVGPTQNPSNYYKKADISFVCSNSEAFGRTIIESMMSGCLVIGANTAGSAELIKNKIYGYTYKKNSYISLYKKILFAINHIDLSRKIAQAANEYSINNFNSALNCKNIYNSYKESS